MKFIFYIQDIFLKTPHTFYQTIWFSAEPQLQAMCIGWTLRGILIVSLSFNLLLLYGSSFNYAFPAYRSVACLHTGYSRADAAENLTLRRRKCSSLKLPAPALISLFYRSYI
ncbi:MAG: hypothetical protein QM768_07375 [Agriterribacter sp.]